MFILMQVYINFNVNFTFLFSVYHIFSLLSYMVKNKHLFAKNLEVHNHDTRSASNFHLPISNLTKYQIGAHYTGIQTFIHLPPPIKFF